MLNEIIHKNTTIKVFLQKNMERKIDEDTQSLVCVGKAKNVIDEKCIEFIIDADLESNFEKNICYLTYIYSLPKVYMCSAYYRSSYLENGKRVVEFEIVSSLEKVQRRMHQRVSCHAKLEYQSILDEKISEYQNEKIDESTFEFNSNIIEDTLVDISGGGIRFTSKERIDIGKNLAVRFEVTSSDCTKPMSVFGKVVYADMLRNENNLYDIRMKYIKLSEEKRKEIIHFVFQLERENRNFR